MRSEFVILCLKHTIDPNLALENEEIQQAYYRRDWQQVEQFLISNF